MENNWNVPLFKFRDATKTVITFSAPCLTYAKNAEKSKTCPFMLSMGAMFIPGLCCHVMAKTRTDVRNEHNIDGSYIGDCFLSIFCPCCSMLQVHHQLNPTQDMLDQRITRI